MAKRDDLPEDVRREIEIAAIKAYEEEKAREKARGEAKRNEELRKENTKRANRVMFLGDLFGIPYDRDEVLGRYTGNK